MSSLNNNRWFRALVLTLLGLLVIYMLLELKPLFLNLYKFISAVLAPFFIAIIISYVLNPIVSLLNQRKVPRSIAVLLIYAAFIASTAVILMNLIPMFIKQLEELNEHLPQFTARAQAFISQVNENRHLPESVRTGVNNSLIKMETGFSRWISNYIDGLGNTLNALFIAFIIPFLAFYILKDFNTIQKGLLSAIPKKHRKHAVRLIGEIDEALGSYVRGQFLVCLIVGILAWIGYWIIGLPYPLLFASVVALTNIIPYLGPYLGAAPALLFAATLSWKMVLYVALVNWLVQLLEGNVISPQVVGKTLHMHPMTIIFVLLVGGELAGIMGLILAVPFYAVIKVFVQYLFQYYIRQKTP
ncbi:AI-2E family transporter [Gorillibacterium massiliense]|uniref:AI-2E family transporter n=1 Tax=Gorillibacterium massiliense TaxID=1280390 RepID=UPI0004B5CABF|nr:AI-2E family transporter [Gorillibacterium massiliense]